MKSTKKSLIASALSLVLCISMLLGTTYAWFTDSVTSGKNKINAGNLDIDLEYTTDGTNWNPVTESTKLFNDEALWEPGYTEVAYLKLSNKGTLALKYQLAINIANEVAGTNVAGDSFKLSDYIKMGVVENWDETVYADRAAARAAVSEAGNIATYTKQGDMLAGADALTFAIVAYMPEDVGNEANYKTGTTAPSIEMGVNVVATQLTSESDSFDNQYDGAAWVVMDETNIALIGSTGYKSLAEAATAAKAGDTIEILRAGTYPYNDLNAINDKAVTVKSTLSSNEAVVLERVTTGTDLARANGNGNRATFENLTVKFADSEVKNGITHNPNGGAMVGNVKFKNCVISGFLYGYDDMTFTDCKFVLGANESKLNMTTYGANVTYTRCTFDGSVNVYWDSITADRKIVFDTCTFNKADKVNDANAAVFVKAAGFETKSKKLEVEFIGEQTLNGYENATYMNNDEIKWNGLRYISADGLWQVDDLENAYATVKVKGAEVFPFANLTSGSFILRDTDTAEITNSLIAEGYAAVKGDVAGNHNNGTPYYLYTVTAQ